MLLIKPRFPDSADSDERSVGNDMTVVIRLADGTGLRGTLKMQMLEAAQCAVNFRVFPSQTRFPASPLLRACGTLGETAQMA